MLEPTLNLQSRPMPIVLQALVQLRALQAELDCGDKQKNDHLAGELKALESKLAGLATEIGHGRGGHAQGAYFRPFGVVEQTLSELLEHQEELRANENRTSAVLEELRAVNYKQERFLTDFRNRFEECRKATVLLLERISGSMRRQKIVLEGLASQHRDLVRSIGKAVAYAAEPLPKPKYGQIFSIRGIRLRRNRSSQLVALGDLANRNRDWAAAASHYGAALQIDPTLAAIWIQYGHMLKERGLTGLAEIAYVQGTMAAPNEADGFVHLGYLLKDAGQADAARSRFEMALKLNPELNDLAIEIAKIAPLQPLTNEEVLPSIDDIFGAVAVGSSPLPSSLDNGSGARMEEFVSSLYPADSLNRSLSQRYGRCIEEAIGRTGGQDVIWLGVIDWSFRIQRPQHLATHLAVRGKRVFYISTTFEAADSDGCFRIVGTPQFNVFEIRLRLRGSLPVDFYAGFTSEQIEDLQFALDEVILVLGISAPAVIVEYPSWHSIALGIPGGYVVHDCLDLVGGFNNVPPVMVELEAAFSKAADLVVTSSQPLSERLDRNSLIVRNGADVRHFSRGIRGHGEATNARPLVGYFGAIAEWFEIDWVLNCAAARPGWDFVLIGNVSAFDIADLDPPANVAFVGELPYEQLPEQLYNFDVAIIPFKLTDLIQCTNPVKLYEYMAAGKPVVASAMPEVLNATDLVYIAHDSNGFEAQIARALLEDSSELQHRRVEWANKSTWESRVQLLASAIEAGYHKVSIVILTYNNWAFTRACLHSVLTLSDYENLEVIIVDNASTDETRDRLRAIHDPRVRVILNDENIGFAAGNNVGLREAVGEYIILLNNDTYVTKGWVRDLIRPLVMDPKVGLVGPVTNSIGNEQKLSINYSDMFEMASVSRRRVRSQLRARLEVRSLAFFCTALSRKTIERAGYLNEVYGLGFFEDDDYCRRVEEAGLKLLIADDVFVHHHLSASFDALGLERKRELMNRNRVIFEKLWGPWTHPRYRNAKGFGG